jgi:hypothetical protein
MVKMVNFSGTEEEGLQVEEEAENLFVYSGSQYPCLAG